MEFLSGNLACRKRLTGYYKTYYIDLYSCFEKGCIYKGGNAYTTMSKVIKGNGGFTVALLKLKEFQGDRRKQHQHVYFSFLLSESP